MSNRNSIQPTRTVGSQGRGCVPRLVGIVAGLLVLGLGLILAGTIFESLTEASDIRAYPPPGQLIDMGGYRLHINCTGSGSPTVVIEAGLSDWSASWSLVQLGVEKTTRVCTYDRAGLGYSTAGPLPRNARQFAQELHTLLQRANVPGPYILVGHSIGGYTAIVFAHDYSGEVSGVVLVDSTRLGARQPTQANTDSDTQAESAPGVDWILPALARIGFVRLVTQPLHLPAEATKAQVAFSVRPVDLQTFQQEVRGIPASVAQARNVATLGDMPLIVLSARLGDTPSHQADQADMLQLSSHSEQLFAEQSGHNIELEQPEAAVAAIVKMVEQLRRTANQ
jgi:pimeloyl-ACP methyl ester carboxylesterase